MRLLTLFLLMVLSMISDYSFGQEERLGPIHGYPELYTEESNSREGINNQYIFRFDTLGLPFRDDFTRNRIKNYAFDANAPGITSTPFYLFTIGGAYPSVFEAMYDTSYNYTFNTSTMSWDSVQNSFTVVELLDANSQLPILADTVWIKPNGTISGDTLDTNNVSDTVYVNTFDTVFVIPSSGPDVYWISNDVYINQSYPVLPPSFGVATFDGLDSLGKPYAPLSQSGSQGLADVFTSAPIDLLNNPFGGVYTVADSVYFSFYYQPQGLGEIPEESDSLVLEFYDVDQNDWVFQWKAVGEGVKPFEKVFVKLEQGRFFRDGFRFRFKNYATLNGAFDHWNIDYVELDVNRAGARNTPLDDVAFIGQGKSILNEYTKMPWTHFKTDPLLFMDDTSTAVAFNNFNANKNVRFGVKIYEQNQEVFTTDFNQNVEPIFQPQTTVEKQIDISPFVFSDTSNAKRYTFDVKNILNTTPDVNLENDTLVYKQDFGTFYSYDDGSAENVYYLVSAGANLAVEYSIQVVDTLRAINIYFPESGEDITNRLFRIKVWSSLNPEVVAYEGLVEVPLYSFERNRVVRYEVPPIPVTGTFYIGYEQLSQPIFTGFDRNNNSRLKTFYSINNVWSQSSFEGTPMIHPEFDSIYYPWNVSVSDFERVENELNIYPNPTTNLVNLEWYGLENVSAQLFDLQGRLIRTQRMILSGSTVTWSNLDKGIYVVRMSTAIGEPLETKQLIVR